MLATKREPAALCVPKLPLRQRPPGRIARSAVCLVGSPPSTCPKVPKAARRCRMSRHVPAILGPPQRLPTAKRRALSRAAGAWRSETPRVCRGPHAPAAPRATSGAPARRRQSPPRTRPGRAARRTPAVSAPPRAAATAPGTRCMPSSDLSPRCPHSARPPVPRPPTPHVPAAPPTRSPNSGPPPLTRPAGLIAGGHRGGVYGSAGGLPGRGARLWRGRLQGADGPHAPRPAAPLLQRRRRRARRPARGPGAHTSR